MNFIHDPLPFPLHEAPAPIQGPRPMPSGPSLSLSDLLDEVQDRGWHVAAIHEDADRHRADRWIVRLRLADPCEAHLIAYGQGPSLEVALTLAIDNMDTAAPEVV